ncbi:MAG TPA: nitroreductase [bacterium (Candidatus Stahlbacteria)]|nr:nitroreductase [Candidatus Stahlbacteria bacterium]
MDVIETIEKRRALRSLMPVEITWDLVLDLARAASLAPSCFNKQPWRFVFVYDSEQLERMHSALSQGNEWARDASMIIAVFSRLDLDCKIMGRFYYLFDTGMATSFLILRATELGLVAHPIAGFNEDKVKEILEIPEDMIVITLVMIGKHSEMVSSILNKDQAKAEKERPERMAIEEFVYRDRYLPK